jgi:hypothetical protein
MTAPNSVVEPIEKSWQQLDALVESLGPHGLTMTGADGWAVKDHLVHLAAWEHSLIALLEGMDRRNAMGVAGEAEDTDSINAAVWSLHQAKTPEQALAYFHDTHAVLMKLLGKMSDADLQLSYNHYQPNDPRNTDDDRPVRDWVAGNTYEHYAEHTEWINHVIKDSSAAR